MTTARTDRGRMTRTIFSSRKTEHTNNDTLNGGGGGGAAFRAITRERFFFRCAAAFPSFFAPSHTDSVSVIGLRLPFGRCDDLLTTAGRDLT